MRNKEQRNENKEGKIEIVGDEWKWKKMNKSR